MWNPREQHHHVEEQDQVQDEDDSWEVRAFAEDANNIMGTTWPPRSYSCTFCRREFRSAQALGGHMNVHRRDRARLHHHHHHQLASPHNHNHNISSFSNHTPSFLNISHQEPNFVANGGLCLLYPFPIPNNNNNNAPLSQLSSLPHNNNACGDSPSTVFSVSSSSSHDSLQCPPIMVPPSCSATSFDYFSAPPERNNNVFSSCSGKVLEQEPATTTSSSTHEELDLELRLGNRSTSSS